jgi:zinc transport system ATP-binding protein
MHWSVKITMKFNVPIFETKFLHFVRQNQNIVNKVSLRINRGDYTAIIGPNGGGKTTLIRLLLGLEKPTSGDILLFGLPLKKFNSWDKIGFVPQRVTQIDLNFPATVIEVVKMGRIAKRGFFKKESPEDLQAIEDAMKKMNVTYLKDKLIGDLSGGQRQRVMIARALASKPEVIILDEPNTGVDAVSQQRFYSLLKELNEKEKLTILFITHDIGVIANDIDSILCINQGLLSCNSPHEAMSCSSMSKLYGIDAHIMHHHH